MGDPVEGRSDSVALEFRHGSAIYRVELAIRPRLHQDGALKVTTELSLFEAVGTGSDGSPQWTDLGIAGTVSECTPSVDRWSSGGVAITIPVGAVRVDVSWSAEVGADGALRLVEVVPRLSLLDGDSFA